MPNVVKGILFGLFVIIYIGLWIYGFLYDRKD